MTSKICIISFDHWNYDKHIVTALQEKGIDSFHIKIGEFQYKNIGERIANTFSKIFLGSNPKIKKRQEYILDSLQKRGKQDQILVINPELIDKNYHLEIKKYTSKYIAYLYDSMQRCPIPHLLDGVFDAIYSFDKEDCEKYGFEETSNYIYFEPKKHCDNAIVQEYIYIGSIDERLEKVEQIGRFLKANSATFKLYAIGKKATWYRLKNKFTQQYKTISFRRKRFTQEETLQKYKESTTIIDIVRNKQTGLSFRIFEALGLQKNVLTNNTIIQDYDIYASGKINILSEGDTISKKDFAFEEKLYTPSLQLKYHLSSWVAKVFNLP